MNSNPNLVAKRVRLALELAELGEAMMRQRLARSHPNESNEEIEKRIAHWRQQRPGAEDGDGVGRPVPWPHRG